MRRSFWAALCGKKHPLLEVNPVGSTFNIQNSIPHKSQKPKAVPEINRPIEFQRGTAEVPESAKEGDSVLPEGSDIGLGAGCRGFESLHSDQNFDRKRKIISAFGHFYIFLIEKPILKFKAANSKLLWYTYLYKKNYMFLWKKYLCEFIMNKTENMYKKHIEKRRNIDIM